MPQYAYVGTKSGSKAKGNISAASEGEARTKLRFMGITVTSLANTESSSSAEVKSTGIPFLDELLKGGGGFSFFRPKVKDSELVVFTKQLSTLIDSGVAIVSSLEMLAVQAANPRLKEVIGSIRGSVEGGMELAKALEKHPDVFDTTYVALVHAGAMSGQLDVILKKICTYVEKANKLRRQLVSALTYPSIVLVLAFAMTALMLIFVVPMFAKNYSDSGKELPELTKFVIQLSDAFQDNFLYIIAGFIGVGIAFTRWRGTPAGARQFDAIMLKLPVFGNLVAKIAIARFTSTMSTLISAGVALPESLRICGKASGNLIIESEILKVEDGVNNGKSLAEMLQKSYLFPVMVSGMIGIGESTGKLDVMMAKVAEIYEEDVDVAMAAALKMVEPLMFVIVGGIVGFILLAMYLPIFDMASTQL